MELNNYLRDIDNKDKLYIVTNNKILDLLNTIYKEIKLTITAKKFLCEMKISKSVFTEILSGGILPSLKLIESIEQKLRINIIDSIYNNVDCIRGKTNSNIVQLPKFIGED